MSKQVEDMLAGMRAPDMTDPDNPELTEADFAKMRPPEEVLPAEILAQFPKAKVGRPKSEAPKVHVSVRWAPDLVEFYKSQGKGWATAMETVLRQHMERERGTRVRSFPMDTSVIIEPSHPVGSSGYIKQMKGGRHRDAHTGSFMTPAKTPNKGHRGKRS